MKPPQRSSRIHIGDLKAQLVKRIGAEKSKRYLYYLNCFFNQKLSKSDFDKLCSRVLGRENLPLHNLFILSILKNACNGEASTPSLHEAGAAISEIQNGGTQSPPSAINNGAVLPMSPRKGRSRKLRDRPSPLGPFGKSDTLSYQSTTTDDSGGKPMMENGDSTPCDYLHPAKHSVGIDDQCENQGEVTDQQSLRRAGIKKVYGGSLYSKDHIEAGVVEDGEEVEQPNQLFVNKTPLIAPLGIPFCSASLGGAARPLRPPSSNNYDRYCDSGYLPCTETLKMRMEQIAVAQGLGGVSIDSATMLNNMLDVYMKRLIKSSVELVRSRSGHEPNKQPSNNQLILNKLLNGTWTSNHLHMQSSIRLMQIMHEQRTCSSISLLDFKVAMDLNPRQLGEDWPVLLEKICMHQFEE